MSDEQQCNLNNKNNHSDPYHLSNTYGGIPQNLLTNLIGLTILLVLFLILRKSALKVLNKIVLNKDDVDRWTHIFFSFAQMANPQQLESRRKKKTPQNQHVTLENPVEGSPSALIRSADETTDSAHEGEGDVADHAGSAAAADQIETQQEHDLKARRAIRRQFTLSENPTTFWQWFKTIFTASDGDIEERCGNDALQYLRFQRHIIFYLCIIVVLSIGIILPLNFQGNLQGNATSFEHTTLVNLSADSDLLWVHICMSFLFFPLAILVMRRFSIDVAFQEVSLEISKTVMIEKIPRAYCTEEAVRNYFSEAFPRVAIKDVRFAYDVRKLLDVDEQLTRTGHAKRYCEHHAEMDRKPFNVYSASCSRCSACFCCCCSQRMEGLDYYTQEFDRLSQEFVSEKETALQTPLGIAFVTFRSLNMSKEVYDAFHRGWCHWQWEAPSASMAEQLKPDRWAVTFAPTPDDIQWGNLAVERQCLLIKMVFVNLALLILRALILLFKKKSQLDKMLSILLSTI